MIRLSAAVFALTTSILYSLSAFASAESDNPLLYRFLAQHHFGASQLESSPVHQESRSGCCSHHGGVAGCDASTGHQACNDGSDSPSCGCE